MKLDIYIEIREKEYHAGTIETNDIGEAVFSYDEIYMKKPEAVPISVNLPFINEPYSAGRTRTFFEGLLPEGFTRRTVAHFIHAEESDYLKILYALGKECIGAIRVAESDDEEIREDYKKISMREMKQLANEGAEKSAEIVSKSHLSLTGASGKVGLYFDNQRGKWYLPTGTAPSTHIVKQSHVRLNAIVVNEQLSMLTAKKLGIEVPETFVINTGDYQDADILLASNRYDRTMAGSARAISGLTRPMRLHQEDFAQALGIPSADKYEPGDAQYMKKAFDLIQAVSVSPIEDRMKLWEMIVFDFLIGNTDAHLKNFSLLYNEDGRGIRLAPAYDLVSTTVYTQSTKDMAFRIGGVHSINQMKRDTFLEAAEMVGMGKHIAMQSFDKLADGFEKSLLDAGKQLKEQGFSGIKKMCSNILKTGGCHNL